MKCARIFSGRLRLPLSVGAYEMRPNFFGQTSSAPTAFASFSFPPKPVEPNTKFATGERFSGSEVMNVTSLDNFFTTHT